MKSFLRCFCQFRLIFCHKSAIFDCFANVRSIDPAETAARLSILVFIVLPLPGGFNGTLLLDAILSEQLMHVSKLRELPEAEQKTYWGPLPKATPEEPFSPYSYYISRYQAWKSDPNPQCSGKLLSGL